MRTTDPRYDIVLSFAGEDRKYLEAVASDLRNTGVKVFYDDYEEVSLWGKDLHSHLDYVYRQASRYCVLFISQHCAQKVWTYHERRSAQAGALEENREYILPVRFDDAEIPGLLPTTGFLDLRDIQPAQLASLAREKLGPHRLTPGFPDDVTRLYKALGLTGPKAKAEKLNARHVAYAFYDALGRMTPEERLAIVGVLAFGCNAELPKWIHISLDLLCRMTRLPNVKLLDALRVVRSLGFCVYIRKPSKAHAHELASDDQDIRLSFWTGAAPDATDPTGIVYAAVHCAAAHFCADHGLAVVTARDSIVCRARWRDRWRLAMGLLDLK